jgi:hypothetical protein
MITVRENQKQLLLGNVLGPLSLTDHSFTENALSKIGFIDKAIVRMNVIFTYSSSNNGYTFSSGNVITCTRTVS